MEYNATLRNVQSMTKVGAASAISTVIEVGSKSRGIKGRFGSPDAEIMRQFLSKYDVVQGPKNKDGSIPLFLPGTDEASIASMQDWILQNSQRVITVWCFNHYENRRLVGRYMDATLSSEMAAPSATESVVLRYVADGLQLGEIAEAMSASGQDISQQTIRTHIQNLRYKLKARDKAHLVAIAFRLGYLA